MSMFSKIGWALFGNDDDGVCGPEWFKPEKKCNFYKKFLWWIRNPFHNLFFYVPPFGFANWEFKTKHEKIFLKYFTIVYSIRCKPNADKCKTLRWIGFKFPKVVEGYCGHRPDRGNLGFAFRKAH